MYITVVAVNVVTVESVVVTDAMINEETSLLKAAEAEEVKARPLVLILT